MKFGNDAVSNFSLLPPKFAAQIRRSSFGSCWEWTGRKIHNGYGVFGISHNKKKLVHRLSYELFIGPIPTGLTLDHLCRNRACVRPEHLEAVTQKENVLRGIGFAAINAKKTHCPKGHEYTPENTKVVKLNGWRQCRICSNACVRRCHDRKKMLR